MMIHPTLSHNVTATPFYISCDPADQSVFTEDGRNLVISLTNNLHTVWNKERCHEEWNISTVIPIFKKGARSLCKTYRGIGLVNVASKLLSGLILRRLTDQRDGQVCENQAIFSPGRDCIIQVFA